MENPRLNIYLKDETLHRRIKVAAAMAGLSLSDYCLQAIRGRLEGEETSLAVEGAPADTIAEPAPAYGAPLELPRDLLAEIALRARRRGETTEAYVSELLRRDARSSWPVGFFSQVVGGWRGEPLERAPQGEPEQRELL